MNVSWKKSQVRLFKPRTLGCLAIFSSPLSLFVSPCSSLFSDFQSYPGEIHFLPSVSVSPWRWWDCQSGSPTYHLWLLMKSAVISSKRKKLLALVSTAKQVSQTKHLHSNCVFHPLLKLTPLLCASPLHSFHGMTPEHVGEKVDLQSLLLSFLLWLPSAIFVPILSGRNLEAV